MSCGSALGRRTFPIRRRSTGSWCVSCCLARAPNRQTCSQSGCRNRSRSRRRSTTACACCCRRASRRDSSPRQAGMNWMEEALAVPMVWEQSEPSGSHPCCHRRRSRQRAQRPARSIEGDPEPQHTPAQASAMLVPHRQSAKVRRCESATVQGQENPEGSRLRFQRSGCGFVIGERTTATIASVMR